ncbi:MAG: phosphatase PAP2 family protein [Planctomycetota bacterium]
MRHLFREAWTLWQHWRSGRELATLLAILVVFFSLWAFVEVTDEVLEGETQAIDEKVLLLFRNPADKTDPLGPLWVEEMGRDVTGLGGMFVLMLITGVVAGFLALQRRYRAMVLVLISIGGGLLISLLLKEIFERPRPDLVPHLSHTYTSSFPSGHSMLAATTYLTLGALLARVQPNWPLKLYILGLSVLFTLLVGVSRVYLGVHWPTDVLGGWTAGATWALLCWLVARYLQRGGQVEQDVPQPLETEQETAA